MKTPDEIKKALECCFYDSEQCGECPYYPVSCDRELVRDAREYIRQLEAKQHGAWMTSQLYDADGNTVYIHRHQGCNYEIRGYKEHGTPYCPNCGAKMDAKEE